MHGTSLIKRLLLTKTLALSQTRFLSREHEPSRDLRGQASAMLHANHCRQLIPPRTPEVRAAAELSLRACTLREQYPGARTRAPRQKGAHTKCGLRPHRMDGGVLAYANKAEAATTSKLKLAKLKLGSSHVLVACLGKTAFLDFCSHKVKKWEARNSSQRLRTRSLACPLWTVLRNRSETNNSPVNVIRVRAKKSMLIT
jgi:hypothetical protein